MSKSMLLLTLEDCDRLYAEGKMTLRQWVYTTCLIIAEDA